MEVLYTVVSGVAVYVLGELFNEYYLKPVQKYKELKAKIAYELVLYSCYYSNPINEVKSVSTSNPQWDNASEELRKLAAETLAFAQIIPKINCVLRCIPAKNKFIEVEKNLIGLSNSLYNAHATTNHELEKEIYQALNIKLQEK